MSAYLESTAELERDKVKCLMIDCPKESNKFLDKFTQYQMNFLLNEGILSSATIWEKFIEWSGRDKDGTDAKFASIHEWKDPKKATSKREAYFVDRSSATITGVKKDGDLLIAVYDRWNKINHYFQIPQHAIPNRTVIIEFNHQTKECSSKWGEYKTSINNILNK